MSAVLGLCGLRCSGTLVSIDPHLPRHWKQVTLPLAFRGERLRITLTSQSVTVQAETILKTALTVAVGGVHHPLEAGKELVISVPSAVAEEAF